MIERLAKEGPVTVHLQMDAHMEADVEAGNVMGEIVGSEHPEQVVVDWRAHRLVGCGTGGAG